MENKRGRTGFGAAIVSIAVIAMLLMAGPAQALNLKFEGPQKTRHRMNSNISFNVSLESENAFEINSISLVSDLGKNKEKVLCSFDRNGNALEGCKGISISLLEEGYGYGYGYGYGSNRLEYKINIIPEESGLKLGNNKLYLRTNSSEGLDESKKYNLVLLPDVSRIDFNEDGYVDIADLSLLIAHLGEKAGGKKLLKKLDLDENGRIDLFDIIEYWNIKDSLDLGSDVEDRPKEKIEEIKEKVKKKIDEVKKKIEKMKENKRLDD